MNQLTLITDAEIHAPEALGRRALADLPIVSVSK